MKLEFKVAAFILAGWGLVAMYEDAHDSAVRDGVVIAKAAGYSTTQPARASEPAPAPEPEKIPDWVDDAETAMFVAAHETFKAPFDCKTLRSSADDEWLVGCAPVEGSPMPFLLFSAKEPEGSFPWRIEAVNGKAKQYAHAPAFQEYRITTTTYRTDIDIDAAIYQYEHN